MGLYSSLFSEGPFSFFFGGGGGGWGAYYRNFTVIFLPSVNQNEKSFLSRDEKD